MFRILLEGYQKSRLSEPSTIGLGMWLWTSSAARRVCNDSQECLKACLPSIRQPQSPGELWPALYIFTSAAGNISRRPVCTVFAIRGLPGDISLC